MTPKDYKEIASKSYSVDSGFKKGPITHEGQEIMINGVRWQVLKTKDNGWTGFQAMAVAPVSDGTNPSNVVIAYAGTNPFQFGDLYSDVANVVLSNGGGQMWEAKRFADQVAGEYSDASISVTGHSLGGYLALSQGAEHHWQTVTFNGPDPYENLSGQAKKWVKEHAEFLTNFVNYKDIVTYGGGSLTQSAGNLKTTGKRVWIDNGLLVHSIDKWKFDDKGNVIDGNGKSYGLPSPTELDASMTTLQNSFKSQMKELGSLKKRLSASGGGLSSGEKIYLDSAQALAVVSTAGAEFNLAMVNVMRVYHDGIREAEELWQKTLSDAMATGNQLERWEVYEALESVGCTEYNIVGVPTQQYQMKIDKIREVSEQFKSLENQIKTKISEIVARDSELAQQLRG
jgi:Putative lipase essential for disintegration of autophagic bodies inside the vacuole